jgi:hypothetical protein
MNKLTKNEIRLLSILEDSYEWIYKGVNCTMVSRTEPYKQGDLYVVEERIELGGFDVDFYDIEYNKPMKISSLLSDSNKEDGKTYTGEEVREMSEKLDDALIQILSLIPYYDEPENIFDAEKIDKLFADINKGG